MRDNAKELLVASKHYIRSTHNTVYTAQDPNKLLVAFLKSTLFLLHVIIYGPATHISHSFTERLICNKQGKPAFPAEPAS